MYTPRYEAGKVVLKQLGYDRGVWDAGFMATGWLLIKGWMGDMEGAN